MYHKIVVEFIDIVRLIGFVHFLIFLWAALVYVRCPSWRRRILREKKEEDVGKERRNHTKILICLEFSKNNTTQRCERLCGGFQLARVIEKCLRYAGCSEIENGCDLTLNNCQKNISRRLLFCDDGLYLAEVIYADWLTYKFNLDTRKHARKFVKNHRYYTLNMSD
jgi:hypothetical protein